jgi:hypothetical protein
VLSAPSRERPAIPPPHRRISAGCAQGVVAAYRQRGPDGFPAIEAFGFVDRFPCLAPGADDALLFKSFCNLAARGNVIEWGELKRRQRYRPRKHFLAEVI